MRPSSRLMIALCTLTLSASGCMGVLDDGTTTDDSEDDVGTPPPPDSCNSPDDAKNNGSCQLQLGVEKLEYIGLLGDVDWFSVTLPQGLTGRSLLHVTAGIEAPATAVNLSINILKGDNTSIGTAVDKHGQAAPTPLDMIIRESDSGAQLLIMVSDQTGKNFDYRNPYAIKVEVVDDPDTNEPNDTTPTPIPLTANGAVLSGTQSGYLATANDVDRFTFNVPASNKVLYLSLAGELLQPPPPFRLSYTLYDAAMIPVSEGVMTNQFLAVDLATARTTSTGDYVLEVTGYRNEPLQVTPGDLRLKYGVQVQLLDELDPNEPNNTLETAHAQTLGAPGQSATLHGRLGEIPDADWFAFDLPASSSPTVFYYHLTPGSGAGRFPAIPGPVDRQVRIFTQVTQGPSLTAQQSACMTSASVCPRRDDATPYQDGLVNAYCMMDTPRCMWAARQEDAKYPNLRNFEGAVPVPAHSGTVRYFVLVEDDGNNWADDVEYTLDAQWRADPDEASRTSGGVEQTPATTIAFDSGASGFPAPPSGFELSGTLSYGYGFWRNNDPLKGEGIRAHDDYDAMGSDEDNYELDFPGGLSAPLDQTWELQWEIDKPAGGGSAPYDLALDVQFCDGSQGTGSCHSVNRTLGYTGGNLGSWHSAGVQGAPFQPVYSLEDTATSVKVTALAWGCFCIEPRFVQGGKFFVKVVAVDRENYADVKYHVRTALTSYPKPYNGGMCPAPTQNTDGTWAPGCKFTQ